MSKYKYMLNTEEKQGSMKILSKAVYIDGEFYGGLNFDFYIKESLDLLNLIGSESGKMENIFVSQYGNKDKFTFKDNCLTKEYKINKNSDTYVMSFDLTNEMLSELIDYIMEKYNGYITAEAERNKNEAKLSDELENIEQDNKRSGNIKQQESSIKVVDTKAKSQKELKDFSTFKDVMEMDTYLRTNVNGTAFIKWLQDKKIVTQSQSYAVGDLVHNKSIIELNKLREEYLNGTN